MAERMSGEIPPQRGRSKYPWHEWADGNLWLLKRGEDYVIADLTMQNTAHIHARNHGMKVVTRTHKDGVLVQFSTPDQKKTLKRN